MDCFFLAHFLLGVWLCCDVTDKLGFLLSLDRISVIRGMPAGQGSVLLGRGPTGEGHLQLPVNGWQTQRSLQEKLYCGLSFLYPWIFDSISPASVTYNSTAVRQDLWKRKSHVSRGEWPPQEAVTWEDMPETWQRFSIDKVREFTEETLLIPSFLLRVVCSGNYCIKTMLSPVFNLFKTIHCDHSWAVYPYHSKKCPCLNMPFGFVSHFGMLILCKWPKLNLGTGGPPICI